jgi:rfaE bifunctional protein kinase chain/domain
MRTVGYDVLTRERLEEIIAAWRESYLCVAGDFFLDRYLIIDPELTEPSIETGLDAYQVVEKRPQPGAAGTVATNLSALNPALVGAIGITGGDGEGVELRRALNSLEIDTHGLQLIQDQMTPTYTKPLVRESDGAFRELSRLDMRNRRPMPSDTEEMIITRLDMAAEDGAMLIIADQEDEPEFGVVTPRVVDALAHIARYCPKQVWIDSRGDISRFRNATIKPNAHEACRAAAVEFDGEPTIDQAHEAGQRLMEQTGSWAIVVTLGAEGVLVVSSQEAPFHVPAVQVAGEIDIVGAGDSFTAGMVAALSTGEARWDEAAIIGNLTASITIQQIGTTGHATPEQLLQRLEDVQAGRVPGVQT